MKVERLARKVTEETGVSPHVILGEAQRIQKRLKKVDAKSAYIGIIPDHERNILTVGVIVDLGKNKKPDHKNIKQLDKLASPLEFSRIGEPIDFGLNRTHGKQLQQAVNEKYGKGTFQRIPRSKK